MYDEQLQTQLFINGERCDAAGGATYAIHNPARPSEQVGLAASASVTDVDAACRAAQDAFPAWSALGYSARAAYLEKMAAALTSDEAELNARIHLFTREHGKVLKEASIEMRRLGDRFRAIAGYADRLARNEELLAPPLDTVITRQPRGVAALIVPWNWPLSILGAKLPQALLAGNTVVIKLSSEAALAPSLTICKMAATLPPGVVNLVTGSAANIGDPLLSHPAVRTINFTGSIAVGRHVGVLAAQRLVPATLELGGNDAGLILSDAKLDEAAFGRMYIAAFLSAGQTCMALKRVYVHRSRYDEVVAGLSNVAQQQVIGDGLLPETTMGPLNNKKQWGVVEDMVEEARASGCEVHEFGRVPDPSLFEQGYFRKPTLVLNPEPSLSIVKEEQFGPALPIIPVDSEEDAIAQANDSEFGLCSSVWTEERDRALAVALKLEAGYTYINNHGPLAQDGRGPFGGVKNSGIGRNLGYEGIVAFQEYQSISAAGGWLLGER